MCKSNASFTMRQNVQWKPRNWTCKNEVIDFGGQNETKCNRISFFVLLRLTFEKTTESKSEEFLCKNQSENNKSNYFFPLQRNSITAEERCKSNYGPVTVIAHTRNWQVTDQVWTELNWTCYVNAEDGHNPSPCQLRLLLPTDNAFCHGRCGCKTTLGDDALAYISSIFIIIIILTISLWVK